MRDRFLFNLMAAGALLAGIQSHSWAQNRNEAPGAYAPRAELANPTNAAAAAMGPGGGSSPMAIPMDRPAGPVDPNRKLQPGDQLSFRIEEDKGAPIPLIVSHNGEIEVDPLPRAVRVTGMTPAMAEAEIKRQLEKDYYYTATVRLTLLVANKAATMGYVYFDGAVARIGALPIYAETPMKLSEAISMAGGFARYADDRKVRLTRSVKGGAPQQMTVDVKQITQKGALDLDVQLQAGDRIFVPTRFFQY